MNQFVQRAKGADPNMYTKTLRDLSIQTPLIVGSNHPIIQNKLKMMSSTALNEVKHIFDPKIRETMFMSRLEYIQKSKQFSEKRLDFSIDFIPESRDKNNDLGRFTMDIENGTFQNLVKRDKTNLDLIHQGMDFRISAAMEKSQSLKKEEFERKLGLSKVSFARVKIRQTFRFQFLEFSFTRVYELKKDRLPLINQLQLIFKRDVPQTKEQIKAQALYVMMHGEIAPVHEIEIELVDVAYLKTLLDTNYLHFTKIVDRIMANAEVLYSWPDQFAYTGYKGFFDPQRTEMPVIGCYLDQISGKNPVREEASVHN